MWLPLLVPLAIAAAGLGRASSRGDGSMEVKMTPGLLNCLLELGDALENAKGENQDALDDALMTVVIRGNLVLALMRRIELFIACPGDDITERSEIAELLFALCNRNRAKAKA